VGVDGLIVGGKLLGFVSTDKIEKRVGGILYRAAVVNFGV